MPRRKRRTEEERREEMRRLQQKNIETIDRMKRRNEERFKRMRDTGEQAEENSLSLKCGIRSGNEEQHKWAMGELLDMEKVAAFVDCVPVHLTAGVTRGKSKVDDQERTPAIVSMVVLKRSFESIWISTPAARLSCITRTLSVSSSRCSWPCQNQLLSRGSWGRP